MATFDNKKHSGEHSGEAYWRHGGMTMELMKRDFLTITDDGENICMSLDTTHEDVQKVGKKMAAIRTGLKMDGKGWEAFLKYYLDANNPALLKELIWNSEGNDLKAYYKKMSAFTRAKGILSENM